MSDNNKAIELANIIEDRKKNGQFPRPSDMVDAIKELRRLAGVEAKLRELEQQSPIAEVLLFGEMKEVSWSKGSLPAVGTKLYARPVPDAQPSDKQPDGALVDERSAFEEATETISEASRCEMMWEGRQLRAALAQPAPAAVPDGYAIVPIDPTDEMSSRGILEMLSDSATVVDIYQSMLAAAPQPAPSQPAPVALVHDYGVTEA